MNNTVYKSVSEGMKQQVAIGRHMNRIPLGYKRIYEKGEVYIVPDAISVKIAEAITMIARGVSLRHALSTATSTGLQDPDGKPLHLSTFHRIVTNPFYAGFVRFQGKTYPGVHKAIIDTETFRKAQIRLGQARN